ncbi:uncharacterized protein LOC127130857 [Lathyrus oleraceus]|uniref:uncharacterized protein LOC127130857 n=1 Tax=Pisum sativum TaxID=3888 RepID=UPI0021D23AFF|nr:uncharacterized protein LOC127130857 [Pisum sativum]
MSLVCEETPNSVKLDILKLTSGIIEDIKEVQKTDGGWVDRLVSINQNKGGEFRIDENSVMRFRDQVCVSDVLELKKSILEEGHRGKLSIHPSATKMYQDFKKMFWLPEIKKYVIEFVYAYLTCLSKTLKGYDSIWVIIDRLTKSNYFILIKINHSLKKLVELYIEEIVKLHDIPSSIISDRDPRFTSRLLKSL